MHHDAKIISKQNFKQGKWKNDEKIKKQKSIFLASQFILNFQRGHSGVGFRPWKIDFRDVLHFKKKIDK